MAIRFPLSDGTFLCPKEAFYIRRTKVEMKGSKQNKAETWALERCQEGYEALRMLLALSRFLVHRGPWVPGPCGNPVLPKGGPYPSDLKPVTS